MDIIEKQVEKIKEVPYGYWENCGNGCGPYPYNRGNNWVGSTPFASKGVAGTGLGLGIAGTALGLLALSRNGGLFGNLFGGSNMPENININALGGNGTSNGYGFHSGCAPTTFQVWEKGCEDALAGQKALYDFALLSQNERFNDRQTINKELFSLYKGQIDADFGLYKSSRDGFDALAAKQNQTAFGLYKSQRDADDALAARISALETKQAINDAVDPWRAKVLDMKISGVAANAHAGIALEAERRCCADNKIVNYVNSNFYPVNVADITTAATTTARELYNPLCGCCNSCNQYGV
jgi:hypothetical protein